jgi:hypothetical protein
MEMELTLDELKTLIKEGVEKFHRKSLIENRINQINKELEDLLSENKYSDSASDFIGKEISHLMKDKGYEHKRAVAAAINIARDKGYKVPKSVDESSTDEKISLERLINIAKNAGDIIEDAESELNSLGVAYGERGVPLSRVMNILSNYDIEMDEVDFERKADDDGEQWLSIDDLANKGLLEKSPSSGLSAKQKSDVVKKAKAGEDIGKKGKGFKDVVAKAKASGADNPGAVAAAAMWKNVKRESVSEIMQRANALMDEAKAMEKIKAALKGVSDEQKEYNKKNNLPLDWKGTKEGYHEFITNKRHSSGSN